MSRSVSAPSSVTKTSPCWNGFIVPGSTLMYGSSFCSVTRSPRLLSSRPSEEAVSPLPRLDATPPVTKMCLATTTSASSDPSPGARELSQNSRSLRHHDHAHRDHRGEVRNCTGGHHPSYHGMPPRDADVAVTFRDGGGVADRRRRAGACDGDRGGTMAGPVTAERRMRS